MKGSVCELIRRSSEQELLNFVLHGVDLRGQGAVGIAQDGSRHDVTGDTACPTKVSLLANVDVGDVLILKLGRVRHLPCPRTGVADGG